MNRPLVSFRTINGRNYDPNSLITGREVMQGYTYKNSSRDLDVVRDMTELNPNTVSLEKLDVIAPRRLALAVDDLPDIVDFNASDDFMPVGTPAKADRYFGPADNYLGG